LAQWGIDDAAQLKWLDVPDAAGMAQAKDLLFSLGALDQHRRISAHGKIMARFPMHPRFAHMILKSSEQGNGLLALTIAALMQERDLLQLGNAMRTADLRLRLEAVENVRNGEISQAKKLGCNLARAKSILRQIKIWQKTHRIKETPIDVQKAGLCIAIAFPDRIAAKRSGNSTAFMLSGGRGAELMEGDPLASEKFISIAHLDKGGRDARIYMAAPVLKSELEDNFEELITEQQIIEWDNRTQTVKSQNRTVLGKMALGTSKVENPDQDQIRAVMIGGIMKMGLDVLPWDKKTASLRKRVMLLKTNIEADFPDFTDEHLLENLGEWLGPYLDNINSRSALKKLDLYAILKNFMTWEQQQQLERLTPTHFKVPSGSNITIDYDVDPPALSVKLQEMFGAVSTPTILDGKMSLSVHLLSPARRPLQITTDLGGFWQNSYQEIKKEMKGRYPKHPWPDNPLEAIPTRKLKSKK
ncbi:MAG: ATP-dependent helicase HrpB, partial [Anaerolineae bacterium]|nr:ATP-dependent helicase HrpB [Anaerolineae bacterium]